MSTKTTPPAKSPDLIPQGGGLNFSAPLDQVEGTVVPAPLFFLRSHHQLPDLSATTWSLRIHGRAQRELMVKLSDLEALPRRTQEMWLECAGNSRIRFNPPAEGVGWDDWAVSNAAFSGTSLSSVLEQAQLRPGALEVVATGADSPDFQRALPLDVAMRPDVLLVWEMNGEPIPAANGGPVRLIVPGWPGIASVKWPRDLEIVDQRFIGHYQTERYVIVDRDGRGLGEVSKMPVKSVIASPRNGSRVAPGPVTVFGFAWSGAGPIIQVDVTTDDGLTWSSARLRHGEGPLAWTRWEVSWTPASTGTVRLLSRATDVDGNVQPETAEWNRFGYLMNAIGGHEVEVGAT